VKAGLRSLRPLLPRNITLAFQGDQTVDVDADETELQQALVNLVINARDAMPSGGAIRVTTGTETIVLTPRKVVDAALAAGEWAFLRVEDSGPGIDPALRDRIFEPMFTTKPAGSGTGLGLATVLRVAQVSGGGVSLESAPGSGARFVIYLPAIRAAASTTALPTDGASRVDHGAAGPRPSLEAPRILLAEDAPAMRR
jgi:two-component system cell cycle sensor histidine kinase/response regulator CckA